MSVVLTTDQERGMDILDIQLNLAMAVCYIRMHKIAKFGVEVFCEKCKSRK
jgi:hypothetical protein